MMNKEKCRLFREQRIQSRKAKGLSSIERAPPVKKKPRPRPAKARRKPVLPMPVVGTMGIIGKQRAMEDKISIQLNLCAPAINGARPVHFFAIYDGHGGPHVSKMCNHKMHVLIEEELMRSTDMMSGSSSRFGGNEVQLPSDVVWRRVLRKCFLRADKMASSNCDCGRLGYVCGCPSDYSLGLTGSTALVVVLTDDSIIAANCGDSRVVLGRAGKAMTLSLNPKPTRKDEHNRVLGLGGKMVDHNGPRVQGAIGDNCLKPFVIPEPEITFLKRRPNQDEFLILASDGLWDVIPTQMACNVARECFQGEVVQFSSLSDTAAAVLTRLAVERKSSDNISVIVVDLKKKSC